MLKSAKILLLLLWMGFIFILSDIPCHLLPSTTTNLPQIVTHIILYGVLSYLIILAINGCGGIKRNKIRNLVPGTQNQIPYFVPFFLAIILSVLYGITDEYHQGYVSGRSVSFADLGFNLIGAVCGVFFYQFLNYRRKPRLLLHICCAGCGAYVSQLLKQNFQVTLYFYNSNIYPEVEYKKRLQEVIDLAKKFKFNLIIENYNHVAWLNKIKGYEQDKERGKRCVICYRDRLEDTAKVANEKKFDYFTTTLTVSPHKDAQAINRIGSELAGQYNVQFLDENFKKKDGFKKSIKLSRELGLYRQSYCGCEYSRNS